MIRLRVEGLMLERLMARALEQGAEFSLVSRESARAMIFETNERGARSLQSLCERYSMRSEVLCVTGLNALARLLRRRWSLLPGLVVCVLMLAWYSQHIWFVDVSLVGERYTEVSAADVGAMLEEIGIHPGMLIGDVNPDLIELTLSARSQEFSFVGARIQGVRLLVEIAPSLEAPEVYDLESARDLVAACDGVIVSINAQSGVAAVKPGDTVRRGDVLIRGEERESAEVTRGVAALGEVIARTWVVAEAEGDTTYVQKQYTGRESTSSVLRLMDWAWPLAEGQSYLLYESEVEYLPVGGMFLPLMIERTSRREYSEQTLPRNGEALRAELSEQAFALAEAEIERIGADPLQIVDKWIDYSMIEDGRMQARAVVELHQDIATTREALAQEG